MRFLAVAAAALLAGGMTGGDMQTDSTLRVDAGRVLNQITPWMYGACIEDVNHEIYGGLYAQWIFGESFEEPPAAAPIQGWMAYGGVWSAQPNTCAVEADPGAKLVRSGPVLADGTVACDVRVQAGDNAGLILRVSEPRIGPDAWNGYEISLSPQSGGYLRLGRHRSDWKHFRDVPVPVQAGQWHRLRVTLAGPTLHVYLDDGAVPTLEYTDTDSPLLSGRVGVRTWNANAAFRNLVIETPDGQRVEGFDREAREDAREGVSGMWDPVRTGEAQGRFLWDSGHPFNSARSQRIEHRGGSGMVGVANRGLNRWGLTVRQGYRCAGHLYLRQDGGPGRVMVALQSADGARTYARQEIKGIGAEWRRFDFTLRPDQTDMSARFALWLDAPGTVYVDQVYLSDTGDGLFHGLPMRADIGRMLQAEGLTMLRYGGSMVNAPAYRWKPMVGDRDRRPQYRGTWYPHSTNGFGIEEFVQFCRAAGFECVFAINIEETPQDAADLVDYLNGPVTTPWGRRRAENGHPEPYGVKYIQIGNEEAIGGDPKEYAHYLERFQKLHTAMQPRDPDLQFIIAAWWRPQEPLVKRIVQALSGKAALWDVHVGGDNLRDGEEVDRLFAEMARLFQEWSPGTAMKACVLEENGGRHDMQRALGHARILNATQRHGDFVLMDCPANCLQPWKQNDNGWDQGQLFFTSGQVWGMPPYYAQQMAAANHLPLRVESAADSPDRDLDLTATRSEDGRTLVLKVVNSGIAPHRAAVSLAGFGPVAPRAGVWTLAGGLTDINTPEQPDRIRPQRARIEDAAERFDYLFPAHSYTILRLQRR